jgi:ABC-type phosphate transport system substrate-binding protein
MKTLLLATFALSLFAPDAPALPEAHFKVVVNADNPVNELEAEQIGRLFLRQDTRWRNGTAAEPVDQSARATIRSDFSTKIHRKPVSGIQRYWQKQIFSGRGTPPPVSESDDAVLSFVRSRPGAIGYVSADAEVGDGVKIVAVSP